MKTTNIKFANYVIRYGRAARTFYDRQNDVSFLSYRYKVEGVFLFFRTTLINARLLSFELCSGQKKFYMICGKKLIHFRIRMKKEIGLHGFFWLVWPL